MSEQPKRPRQLDELSASFRALGAREAQKPPVPAWKRWLRRHRKGVGGGFVILALAGTTATATQWISTGDPVDPEVVDSAKYQPGSVKPVVVVTASDKALGVPWGVAIYDSKGGYKCSYSGQLRGERLGVVQDGKFRPFTDKTGAVCQTLRSHEILWAFKPYDTKPSRTIIFGRAGTRVKSVEIVADDDRRTVKPGTGGAFLVVVAGRPTDVSAAPRDAEGAPPVPEIEP